MFNQNQNQNKNNKTQPPDKRRTGMGFFGAWLVALLVINFLILPLMENSNITEATYSDFWQAIESDQVTEVQFTDSKILFTETDSDGNVSNYKTGLVDDPQLLPLLKEKNISTDAEIVEQPSLVASLLTNWIIPILIFAFIWRLISKNMAKSMSGGGLMFGNKDTGKVYVPSADKVSFADVAGEDEAKESLMEIVDFLQHSQKYASIGAQCPKGVLLVGPPGTGKTLLAKAVAGQANVPFFSIAGSEFIEMFVGRGAAKVRDLFKQASEKAPCIIFIDEIDAIGKKRNGMSTNSEHEQTLNQLLTEMDGFEANNGVIILAATNRPEVLDSALLRPGRFDRQVAVELPDMLGRKAILEVHAKKYKLHNSLDFDLIARSTAGASGAQLANILNEAALRAVREHNNSVTQADVEEAVETVIAGQQKKNSILTPKEKRIVAFHETGHALVAALQSHSAPVTKITIVPRTSGALGYTMQVEEDEKSLMFKAELLNKIATICGGRVAEEVIFNEISTGASNDIERATEIARAMVTKYGMSDEFGMMALETTTNPYLSQDSQLTCSPATAQKIDVLVQKLIQDAYNQAKTILMANTEKLHEIAEYLLKNENITGVQFMEILEDDTNSQATYAKALL